MSASTRCPLPLLIAALVATIGGCASRPPSTELLEQAFDRYRVGKTTFQDFASDTGLRRIERELPSTRSYLDPASYPRQETVTTFEFPKGSPWRIYEWRETYDINAGREVRFVVGDLKAPRFVLVFNGRRELTEISRIK